MATQKEVAEFLNLSVRQVNNLLKEGTLPAAKPRAGLDLKLCVHGYINKLKAQSIQDQRQKVKFDSPEELISYEDAKLKVEVEKGRKLELENQREEANVLPTEIVGFILQKVVATSATTFNNLPGDFRRKFPTDVLTRVQFIETAVARACNEMSRAGENLEGWIDEYNLTADKKRK